MDIPFFRLFKRNDKTGLALGGGAVYGAAHIGVLKALEDYEIKVDYISGTSIGAFIAGLYAFNLETDKIEKLVSELNWLDISKISLSKYALLSNEKFGTVVQDAVGDVNIEDAKIELAVVAANISNGEKVVLKEGNLCKAITASTAIPGIFKPVMFDDKFLVDGGIVENVPVDTLHDLGANHTIAVDLNSASSYSKPTNVVEVLLNAFHFTLQHATRKITKKADIVIDPDLSEFNRYDVDQVPQLIEMGFNRATEVLKSKKR